MRKYEQYQDMIARLFPELVQDRTDEYGRKKMSKVVTFQVTDACNLACTYCYQINKGERRMSFETAKKLVDMLLTDDPKLNNYVSIKNSPALIIEFIGGEPFLNIDLISQVVDYFYDKAIEMQHPWATKFRISICSNGVLYRDPKVQEFLTRYQKLVSFSVTIDGNKELHDSCRIFPDGRPSYDLAIDAAQDWIKRGYYMGSKITIAPNNLKYLYDAIIHFQSLGYEEINANTVFEKGWTQEDAQEFYRQLKQVADFWVDNDLVETHFLSLFQDQHGFFCPKDETENDNWCFAAGTSIMTPYGNIPIELLETGNNVLTQGNIIYPVENITTRIAESGYKIKAIGMFETLVTSDHPYLIKKKLYSDSHNSYYSEPYFEKVCNLEKGDLISLQYIPLGNIHYNLDLAYIVGRYIGDGWHSTTGFKLCCSHLEKTELEEKLKIAKIEYSIDKYPTVYQFNIFLSNTELIEVLSCCGTNALEKHIPKQCFSWEESSIRELLHGLIDADGYFYEKKFIIKLNSISKVLCQDVMILLRSLGYFPTCSIDKRAGKGYIEGREVNLHDRYEIQFKWETNNKYAIRDFINNIIWSPITEIETVDIPFEVYNLTVSTNHTFIANGAIVHNCGGTGSMLAMDPDGYLYPCIRYMESSLGTDAPPLRIGHVDTGIGQTECDKNCIDCLNAITRRSQSTDECFNCPIAGGCAWCFKEGTMVLTPHGQIPIETIKPGFIILTADGNLQTVESTSQRISNDCYVIKIPGIDDIHTTGEHPFRISTMHTTSNDIYFEKPRWVNAKDINPEVDFVGVYVDTAEQYNEIIKYAINEKEKVIQEYEDHRIVWIKVSSIEKDEPGIVYNMSVANEHTFIANNVLVHNCSGYNYQEFGTPNKRATYICEMHKARSLANSYFWNKWYHKIGSDKRFIIYCPDEWALKIISEEELNMLKELSK